MLIGIYKNNKLFKTIEKEGKTSDTLPLVFEDLLKDITIDEIYFVNGPGSYMAIKVAYIFLKTFSQIKNIPFFACSGFEVNHNSPIKALGKKYFVLDKNGIIKLETINLNTKVDNFYLPNNLDSIKFSNNTLPNYHLPSVFS